jgi:crossover junction endodeoxyribonuclease RuvC
MATGQARGAALVALADAGLPVGEYGPGEIKLAVTGNGAADKHQVTYMVRAVLGMREAPKPDHAADALAVAICHANCRVARARARDLRPAAAQ